MAWTLRFLPRPPLCCAVHNMQLWKAKTSHLKHFLKARKKWLILSWTLSMNIPKSMLSITLTILIITKVMNLFWFVKTVKRFLAFLAKTLSVLVRKLEHVQSRKNTCSFIYFFCSRRITQMSVYVVLNASQCQRKTSYNQY